MKQLYTIIIVLAIGAFHTTGQAQLIKKLHLPVHQRTVEKTKAIPQKAFDNLAKGDNNGEGEVYFSEDFSQGLNGQDDNGAWTRTGSEGELFFKTFPSSDPNGYDPNAFLPDNPDVSDLYDNKLPNFSGSTTVQSPTAENGFMMVDADRFNASSNGTDPPTENTIDGQLVSPLFDMTDAGPSAIFFHHQTRLCCGGYSLSVEISFNGGEWIAYDVFNEYNFSQKG